MLRSGSLFLPKAKSNGVPVLIFEFFPATGLDVMTWATLEANAHHGGAGLGPWEVLDEVPKALSLWEMECRNQPNGVNITTGNCPSR